MFIVAWYKNGLYFCSEFLTFITTNACVWGGATDRCVSTVAAVSCVCTVGDFNNNYLRNNIWPAVKCRLLRLWNHADPDLHGPFSTFWSSLVIFIKVLFYYLMPVCIWGLYLNYTQQVAHLKFCSSSCPFSKHITHALRFTLLTSSPLHLSFIISPTQRWLFGVKEEEVQRKNTRVKMNWQQN